MVKRDNLIKSLLVGVLGVLLTSGAFIQPASALSVNIRDYVSNTTYESGKVNTSKAITRVDGGFRCEGKYYKNGLVSSLDANKLREGWNSVNGDADKLVLYKNGTLASGWVKCGRWRYFDPTTHFMVANQARVIDGKEYFFNYEGEMLTNYNARGSYYGASGAKEGPARSGKDIYTYDKAFYDYTLDEYDALVKQGKIKVKFLWFYENTLGSEIYSTLAHYRTDE